MMSTKINMLRRRFWLSVVCALLIAVGATAKPLPLDPNLKVGKLSNGMTYYIYPNTNPKGVAVYRLFIKSGSVLENDNQRGLAHFIEHMAFNGTTNFPNDSLLTYLQTNGAKFGRDINAHTSMNETVYKLTVSTLNPDLVENTLAILADWAGGIVFDSLQVEKERGVILSEWLSKEGANRDAQRAFLNDMLNHSRYSLRETIGDTSVIRNFHRQELINYYRKWYNPKLMAIAVVGDVDVQTIERHIRDKFSSIKALPIPRNIDYPIENYAKERVLILENKQATKSDLSLIQLRPMSEPVNSVTGYRNYLRQLFINRLAKQRFSSLSFEDRPYRGGSLGVSSFLNVKGTLSSYVSLPTQNVEEAIAAFAADLEQIYRYGFTRQEIERVRVSYREELRRRSESSVPRASVALMDEIYGLFYRQSALLSTQQEYDLAIKYLGAIDSVSIVKDLHRLRSPRRTHYLFSTFDKEKAAVPSEQTILSLFEEARKKEIPRYTKQINTAISLVQGEFPEGNIVREDTIPEIDAQVVELKNGVKLLFKRIKSDSDRLILSGFRTGGLYNIDSTQYVTGLYAGSIVSVSGTQRLTRDELSHLMTGKSASVRFLIDKTRCGIAAAANPEDMESMFKLLYTRWCEATVDTTTFFNLKQKTIEAAAQLYYTPQMEYAKELQDIVQGRSYTTRTRTASIIDQELRLDDVLPIYNQCFGDAAGFVFSLVGDCNWDEVRSLVDRYLGAIPSSSNHYSMPPFVYPGASIPTTTVDYQKSGNASPKATVNFMFQQDSLYQSYTRFNLLSEVVQGILRTRLLKVLREEMGMIYSVSVGCSSTLYPSVLARQSVAFSCEPAHVDTLTRALMNELQALVHTPQSMDIILADQKTAMCKDWSESKAKSSYWSSAIRNHFYYGYSDWNEVVMYDDLIQSITSEEVAHYIERTMLAYPYVRGVLLPAQKE